MARTVKGCPTAQLQTEDAKEPETDPQQEKRPDTTEGKVIVDDNPDVDYEGSEPKNESVAT